LWKNLEQATKTDVINELRPSTPREQVKLAEGANRQSPGSARSPNEASPQKPTPENHPPLKNNKIFYSEMRVQQEAKKGRN
jgi:hypothetical protein